ncbi:MAG: hypothetical protein Q7R98_01660 [Candidatus Jorgensenbacteria bacterium]|nr:hypothetical protein [Candidatus Jorgensenbacteria bacterium]
MGKIIHTYQDSTSIYPSEIELLLDSNEKVTIGNSISGIKIYEQIFFIFPKLIWRCDNPSVIEKCFPILKTDFLGSPLEQIALDIIKRFKTKVELVSFLVNLKV